MTLILDTATRISSFSIDSKFGKNLRIPSRSCPCPPPFANNYFSWQRYIPFLRTIAKIDRPTLFACMYITCTSVFLSWPPHIGDTSQDWSLLTNNRIRCQGRTWCLLDFASGWCYDWPTHFGVLSCIASPIGLSLWIHFSVYYATHVLILAGWISMPRPSCVICSGVAAFGGDANKSLGMLEVYPDEHAVHSHLPHGSCAFAMHLVHVQTGSAVLQTYLCKGFSINNRSTRPFYDPEQASCITSHNLVVVTRHKY